MEVYTSDSSDTDGKEQRILDYGRKNFSSHDAEEIILMFSSKLNHFKDFNQIETCLLNHNQLNVIPPSLNKFLNLKVLDLSNNMLNSLPNEIFNLPLCILIAKNNQLTNQMLPKTFLNERSGCSFLKELNISGNLLEFFPDQILHLPSLKYLYIGGNKIQQIPKDIGKMKGLQILSVGGNMLIEVPDSVGSLCHLKSLVLSDNRIESLPPSIARLKNLKSLKLHKNQLRHLPKDIIALKNLTELSLRDNPLVVRFVQDMALNPSTLMELAARVVKVCKLKYKLIDLPTTVFNYLENSHCCVNPKCNGVFFDNRIEHIKFVDFCGKYRVPLLQYLCSSKCIEHDRDSFSSSFNSDLDSQSDADPSGEVNLKLMKKVLLG